MFARIKKSGKYQYLQIVENHKERQEGKNKALLLQLVAWTVYNPKAE